MNNGTLTGDTNATVEHYEFKVIERKPFRRGRSVKTCKKCGSKLNKDGRCSDSTCVYSDHPQSTDINSIYDQTTGERLPEEVW